MRHTPVLLDRSLELLAPALTGNRPVVIDATLGYGGHARALLERHPTVHLVGIDRDPEARALAAERLAPFSERIDIVAAVYDEIPEVLDELGIDRVQGILFDLGVSSMQLDEVERGFSYARDAPLDMRMNPDDPLTATGILAEYSEDELTRVFREYGEERYARGIARKIVRIRQSTPITRSAALADLIQSAVPASNSGGHPAKRVFQALRIEVNRELEALERAIPAALDALDVGGRIVVLAYQSLEDRIVKHEFRAATTSSAPQGLPAELPEHAARFRLLVRGAELADDAEREHNPRAIPVRLRAAERIAR